MDVAIVFLPLIGAIIAGLFGRWVGDKGAMWTTCTLLGLSAVLSWIVLFDVTVAGNVRTTELFTWINSGDLDVAWALRVDQLTAVMFMVVTTVSTVIHIYSVGYMAHDPHRPRFFAYLSLFTFFMLSLVSADNFLQMFFGWEGVGLVSYLLIGFWYQRPAACAAAIKAFVVNRVGDVGFALGIAATFLLFGFATFDEVFAATPAMAGTQLEFLGLEGDALTITCILLFIGAMGKSAQLGLHTWLPDAMEGPTPVSALIHAATMVTAGVFMVCRLSPMFEYAPLALDLVTYVGAFTAFFAATIGLVQNDIKRVIAYSTCSQLGYMFFAAGVSAYSASMFHLMTHAYFKALLFLGAGAVIHAVSDEQDMRRMGGLWRRIPITYTYMWIGSLALAGIPPLSGFFSKDLIIESAYASIHLTDGGMEGYVGYWAGVIAAFFTALYSGRLLFMTFHGTPRMDQQTWDHVHESPKVMWVPLLVLAAGAIVAGMIGAPWLAGEGMAEFWGESIKVLEGHNSIEAAHHVPLWVKAMPMVAAVGGLALSWVAYMALPDLPRRVAGAFRPIYLFLYNKWYFDELYDRIFTQPALVFGRMLWRGGDMGTIDRFGPDGISAVTRFVSRGASWLQSGYVYHYAFAMLIGVVALVSWYLV
jgi:NADH-quinone oxidoreductase subunit L